MKLVESIQFGKSRLDKEGGVVRGVKILGFTSQHGYAYSTDALKGARDMYEGIQVNVDHPDRKNLGASRSYRDRFGRLRNVSFQENKGLVGDFHYNKKHPLAEQFEYDVEHDPTNVGFSHNASGSTVRQGKKTIVESIDVLRSVDLVADPATNVGLFESRGVRMRVRRKRVRRGGRQASTKQLIESALNRRERKTKDGEHTETLQLLESVLKKEKNPKRIREKVLTILNLGDKTDFVESRERNDMPKPKKPTEEKLLREIREMKHKNRVRDLCESMGFRPNPVQLKALTRLEGKREVKQLIESLRSKGKTRKGAKSSEGGEGKVKKIDAKSTRALLEDMGLEINDDQED